MIALDADDLATLCFIRDDGYWEADTRGKVGINTVSTFGQLPVAPIAGAITLNTSDGTLYVSVGRVWLPMAMTK